ADALAHAFAAATNIEAWQRTRALRFVFDGERSYLWDRDRALVRLQWSDERLLLRLRSHDGVVFHSGLRLSGSDARHLLERGYRFFAHDGFWLNPVATLFDRGVRRELVSQAGGERLLTRYGSGTAMAGDAYLWLPAGSGLPTSWNMWTGAIPLGGVHASFERWQTLRTGAKVATLHRMRARWLTLSDVEGTATFAELSPGEDPFEPLLH
ncbi:MAG: hypothetical protein ACHQ53_16255, partial [Polyangiales bacterium]